LTFAAQITGPLCATSGGTSGLAGVTNGTCDSYEGFGPSIDNAFDNLDNPENQVGFQYTGGSMPKPSWTRAVAKAVQWFASIAIPDYVIAKQPGRFTDWGGGLSDGGYPDPTTEGGTGGRRVFLQVRNILFSRALGDGVSGGLGAVGAPLNSFFASAKFRGYGGCNNVAQSPADPEGDAHQDSPVAGDGVLNGTTPTGQAAPPVAGGNINDPGKVTAFGDMDIPSNPLVADSQNLTAPIFGGSSDDPTENGVCRIDTIVEIPDTVAIGDVIELTCGFTLAQLNTGAYADVSYYAIMYRFILGPTPFNPNTSLQQISQSDNASGNDQLESQSRDDDLPYAP
jgi:hypothetical protein